ncbi:hypothetical protein FQN57_001192 [Myotisia sp. PD_48]|nr:hypothetical protein FQN57_001192 [Myotisia sp. PD_48]
MTGIKKLSLRSQPFAHVYPALLSLSDYGGERYLDIDDWLVVIAYVRIFTPIILIGHTVTSWNHIKLNFIGLPKADRPPPRPEDAGTIKKWSFANQVFYTPALPLIKLSMLIFLSRLKPPSKNIVRMIWGTFALTAGLFISGFLVVLFQCRPVKYAYTPDRLKEATCIDRQPFFIFGSVTAIVTDLMVLSIPIAITYELQLPLRRKIAVTLLLSLGAIVTVISTWRLIVFVLIFYTAKDTIDSRHIVTFCAASIETHVAVICACGPAMKPVIKRYFPRIIGTSQNRTGRRTYGLSGGYAASGTKNSRLGPHHLRSSNNEDDMFEMTTSGHRHRVDIAGGGLDGTAGGVGKKVSKRLSVSESDEEQIMNKAGGIVRTLDVSVKYQTEDGQHVPRQPSREGRATSVDSLV